MMTYYAAVGGDLVPEFYEQARDGMAETSCFRSKNNSCLAHFHSSIELVYVLEGTLSAVLDGQRHDVSKGGLLITSGYAVHRYFTEHASDAIFIIIPLSFVPALEKSLANKRFKSPIYREETGELSVLIPLIHKRWESLGLEARRGFSQLVLGMLTDRVGLDAVPSQAPAGLMRSMLVYLQENCAGRIPMDQVAHHFGYSRSRLSHLFRDNFGCSYTEYTNSLRCRRAAQLLTNSDLGQLEVSLATGFECIRTFYRAFRKCYGMTPRQYARSLNQPGGMNAAHP